MRKWICTVCDYVHEGGEPPEECPVCGAGAEDFELVPAADAAAPASAGVADSAASALEEVRQRAQQLLKGICGVYPACDGRGDRICQRAAYGRPIGMGGAGAGGSFAANVEALARVRLVTRVVGDHFDPDIGMDFLGTRLSMPILASSAAGPGRFCQSVSERDICDANVQGCLDAGTLALRGDTSFYTSEDHPALAAIAAVGGRGIPIFKPRAQDVLLACFARAEALGCPAVGVDLDGCGSSNMAAAGQAVYRKRPAELRQLVQATGLPVIFKGIMCAADAEACIEAGAKVVGVSNHGGRVLDGTPGVADVLPAIADHVGGAVIITADGGVRTGYDVLKMLALGADAVLLGRDLVRASIGGGAAGVQVHLQHVARTLKHAMLMTGCRDLAAIGAQVLHG